MFSGSTKENLLNKIHLISERLIVFDGLDDIFTHIVKTAVDLTMAEAATIRVFNLNTGKLDIVKGFGLSNGFLSQPSISIGEGIIGRVVLEGTLYMSADVMHDPHCINKEFASIEGIRSMMSIPLKTKERPVGCITVYRKKSKPFSDNEMLILSIFALQSAEAIEKTNMINELKNLATCDQLTGAHNKSMINRVIEEKLALALRYSLELSVIFLDIDNFKQFNDNHGHLLGDKLLIDFVKILKNTCRKYDSIGRFGGEEFIIVTPHTVKKKAFNLANRLRNVIAKNHFVGKEDSKVGIGFSAGIATFPEDGDAAVELLKKADDAMYQSKRSGKNRVTAWSA